MGQTLGRVKMENTNFWNGFDKIAAKKKKKYLDTSANLDDFRVAPLVGGLSSLVGSVIHRVGESTNVKKVQNLTDSGMKKLRSAMGVSPSVKINNFASGAHYHPGTRSVGIAATDSVGTLAHEFGHSTEKSLQNLVLKLEGRAHDKAYAALGMVEMLSRKSSTPTLIANAFLTGGLSYGVKNDKIKNDSFDYAPLLLGAGTSLPTLISEGRASIKGFQGIAKAHNFAEAMSHVPALSGAFLTYTAPLASGIAGTLYLKHLRKKHSTQDT